MSNSFFNVCIVGKRRKNHGTECFQTGCTRSENIKTLNSLRHIFPEIRRATLLRLLKLAVKTYRPFVAICLSWRLRYRRPIPKAYTHTPWLLKASAGLRTRSCEMPSVMTTSAFKENRNRCHWVSLISGLDRVTFRLEEREEAKVTVSCFTYLQCSPTSSKQSI